MAAILYATLSNQTLSSSEVKMTDIKSRVINGVSPPSILVTISLSVIVKLRSLVYLKMEGEKATVCVTGGAGYLASWLIMRLLQRGYSVRTTVRSDAEFKEDVNHLKLLPGASERLQIFDADLTKPESFEPAIKGSVCVFHVAHPMALEGETISDELVIKTSVEGTLGILNACLNSKTVKKFIYTSAVVAAMFTNNIKDLKEVDEDAWTDVDFCKSLNFLRGSYIISKTLTEKAALRFGEEHGLDVMTVLPPLIVGPFIGSDMPGCLTVAFSLLSGGDPGKCNLMRKASVVHINDVAMAHIFLFESTKATNGRYICSCTDITIHQLVELFSAKYPELQLQPESFHHSQRTSLKRHRFVFDLWAYPYSGNRKSCYTLSSSERVHIDDLATAYIFLFEYPKVDGRYICSYVGTLIHKHAKFLSIRYPELTIATDLISEMKKKKPVHLSSKKLLDLGFKFSYGLEEMMDGAIKSCKEKGFL